MPVKAHGQPVFIEQSHEMVRRARAGASIRHQGEWERRTMSTEQAARQNIDRPLMRASWRVCGAAGALQSSPHLRTWSKPGYLADLRID